MIHAGRIIAGPLTICAPRHPLTLWLNAVHERWVICNARHISLCRDWTSCFGFLLTHRTYLWNCHKKFYCSFFCLSMEISPRQFWGSWFHTKSRFPTGNSHLPRGKTGCITAPIKYDNFSLCQITWRNSFNPRELLGIQSICLTVFLWSTISQKTSLARQASY